VIDSSHERPDQCLGKPVGWLRSTTLGLLILILGISTAAFSQDSSPRSPGEKKKPPSTAASREALEKLKLPGVKIDLDERCIDVDATVCLDAGTLELIACTNDTKEHESIVAIDAKAVHIHTALLLLGSKSGNPAMRKRVGEKEERWVDIPPAGGVVGVSLVFKNDAGKTIERPISDFITSTDRGADSEEAPSFPGNDFLFAGSHLVDAGTGPRAYLSDRSGNVISITTFGDELLCLPEIHGHGNDSLLWQIDDTHLPPVGSKLTLRLRPESKLPAKK
jgi:hypothetical protein